MLFLLFKGDIMRKDRIEKALILIETNFEKLSFSTCTFSDLCGIFSNFLVTIAVLVTFVFFLIYALLSEKIPDLYSIVAIYVTIVALIVTTARAREQLLREVEFQHNLRIIEESYSKKKLFERDYPIIKMFIILKQEHPEINLCQLYKLDKNIFTTENLLNLLYGVNYRIL